MLSGSFISFIYLAPRSEHVDLFCYFLSNMGRAGWNRRGNVQVGFGLETDVAWAELSQMDTGDWTGVQDCVIVQVWSLGTEVGVGVV